MNKISLKSLAAVVFLCSFGLVFAQEKTNLGLFDRVSVEVYCFFQVCDYSRGPVNNLNENNTEYSDSNNQNIPDSVYDIDINSSDDEPDVDVTDENQDLNNTIEIEPVSPQVIYTPTETKTEVRYINTQGLSESQVHDLIHRHEGEFADHDHGSGSTEDHTHDQSELPEDIQDILDELEDEDRDIRKLIKNSTRGDSDNQDLSFNSTTGVLSIQDGNTVDLSNLVVNASSTSVGTVTASTTNTQNLSVSGTSTFAGPTQLNGTTTISSLTLDPINTGTTTDKILVIDPATGEVKEIDASVLVADAETLTVLSASGTTLVYQDEDGGTTTIDVVDILASSTEPLKVTSLEVTGTSTFSGPTELNGTTTAENLAVDTLTATTTNTQNLTVTGTSTFAGPTTLNGTTTTDVLTSNNIITSVITAMTGYFTNLFTDTLTATTTNTVDLTATGNTTLGTTTIAGPTQLNGTTTISSLTLDPINTGTTTDKMLVIDPVTGEVKEISGSDFVSANETLTVLTDNNDGSFTYTDEDGGTTTIAISDLLSSATGTLSVSSLEVTGTSTFAGPTTLNGTTTAGNLVVDTLTATTTSTRNLSVSGTSTFAGPTTLNGTTTTDVLTSNNIITNAITAMTGYFTNLFTDNLTATTTNTVDLTVTGDTILATTTIAGPTTLNGTTTISSLTLDPINTGTTTDKILVIDPTTGEVKEIDAGDMVDEWETVTVLSYSTTTQQLVYTDEDGSTTTASLAGLSDSDWHVESTANNADDISDNIYTLGEVTIGTSSAPSTDANLSILMQDNGLEGLDIRNTSTSSSERLVQLINNSDSGVTLYIRHDNDANPQGAIRIDGPKPEIEFVETDQAGGVGKWEIQANGGDFGINSRLANDSGFEKYLYLNGPLADGGQLVLNAQTNSATRDLFKISNSVSSAGSAPGFAWENTAGGLVTSRLSSAGGSGFTNSNFRIQVADSSKTLQERLRIDVDGDVGIGTTNPTNKLHINNNTGVFEVVRVENSTAGGSSIRYIDSANTPIEIGSENGDAVIRTNSTIRLIAKTGSGNVGIGTTAPTEKLDVDGEARIRTLTAGSSTADSTVVADADGVLKKISTASVAAANEPWFGTDDDAGATDNTEDIYALGNVGIGTTNPTYKLQTAGANSDASINGVRVGKGGGDVGTNTAVGDNALASNTTGYNNSAHGSHALGLNTTGILNAADGYYALYNNTTGAANTANGAYALLNNTTASYNTATGYQSLYENTTGANNTANGAFSLNKNTTGSNNVANGAYSLQKNTTGGNNVANGVYALHENTTGNFNVAIGRSSLLNNTTGSDNMATGAYSLNKNTTGHDNVADGRSSLYNNTTGNFNIANGSNSLYGNTTGSNNTSNGYRSLYNNTTGTNNIAFGYQAGDNITTGSSNIVIGSNINAPSATADNQLNIGNWIYGDDGDIGIGTDSPDSKLHVVSVLADQITGGRYLEASEDATIISKLTSASTNNNFLFIGNDRYANYGGTKAGIILNANNGDSNQPAHGYRIMTEKSANGFGNASFSISSHTFNGTDGVLTERFKILSNGDIGIGVSAPTEKLDVDGEARIRTLTAGSSTADSIVVADTDGVLKKISTASVAAANEPWFGTDDDAGATDNTEDIYALGNVGIGTTNPTYKLQTAGTNSDASINGVRVGKGGGDVGTNTAVGNNALSGNTTGSDNTAIGRSSLLNNTTGYSNTAIGSSSLKDNTTGRFNTANGLNSLRKNTTGHTNTATGYNSLSNNTTGLSNTANGADALSSNTTGSNNVANGYQSLYSNTTGYSNTAIGQQSLLSNTTGLNNTAIGRSSLLNNTTGYSNTATGRSTLFSNTTGYDNAATGRDALFSNTTGSRNTATGNSSLYYNTTGSNNVASGYESLRNNTTGANNTANGAISLRNNTTGYYNTANGVGSLYSNTTGGSNTAVGGNALRLNTTGNNNTATGRDALYSNTTGGNNTANGFRSLYANTTGVANTANGYQSLRYNTTGNYNSASGFHALYANTTGSFNLANGADALRFNTTGSNNTANGIASLYANTTGNSNTANGRNALRFNTTGSSNTANGYYSLYSNTTGSSNTANGYQSLYSNTTGINNTVLGYTAGDNITTGSSNIVIGSNINAPSATADNQLNIGNWIYGAGGNIGIGVAAPTEKLDVDGEARIRTLTTGSSTVDSTVVADADGVLKKVSAASVAAANEPWFGTDDDAGATLNTENIYSLGRVGVGTTTLSSMFTVNSNIQSIASFAGPSNVDKFSLSSSGSGGGVYYFGAVNAGTGSRLLFNEVSGNIGIGGGWAPSAKLDIVHTSTTTDAFRVADGGSAVNTNLVVKGNGNIGVGLADPDSKLQVSYGVLSDLDVNNIRSTAALTLSGDDPGVTSDSKGVSLVMRPIKNRGAVSAITTLNDGSNKEGNANMVFMTGQGGYPSVMTEHMRIVGSTGNILIGGDSQIGGADPKLLVQNADDALTTGDYAATELLQLSRDGTSGNKWGANAQFKLGSYSNNSDSRSSLQIALTDVNNDSTYNTVMTMNGNGNVGIGTAAPSESLHILNGNQIIESSSSAYTRYVDNGATPRNFYSGINFDAAPNVYSIGNKDTDISFVAVDLNGNVGIGTTAPSTKLDIRGADAAITVGTASNTEGALYLGNTSHGIKRNYNATNDVGLYTTSGSVYLSAANSSTINHFVLNSAGNVGIGTGTPNSKLDVIGTIQASNLLGGAVNLTTDANGNIIRDPSDANLKENIRDLEGSALDKILQLRGVSYEWKDKDRFGDQTEIGFVAQELQKVLPEVVRSGGEYLSVNIRNILGIVVEGIKELSDWNDEQDDRIAELEDAWEGGNNSVAQSGATELVGSTYVSSGDNTVDVEFDREFDSAPIVMVTPHSGFFGDWWVSDKSRSGFTIKLEKNATDNYDFDWFARGESEIVDQPTNEETSSDNETESATSTESETQTDDNTEQSQATSTDDGTESESTDSEVVGEPTEEETSSDNETESATSTESETQTDDNTEQSQATSTDDGTESESTDSEVVDEPTEEETSSDNETESATSTESEDESETQSGGEAGLDGSDV